MSTHQCDCASTIEGRWADIHSPECAIFKHSIDNTMTENEKLKHCLGCRDDFYNDKNPMGVKRCWGLKTAKMVTRYRIGTWMRPTEPGAFAKCKVLSCYHQDGMHYVEALPDFVKHEDVAGANQRLKQKPTRTKAP